MKNILLLLFTAFSQFCYSQLVSEYPPYLPDNFAGIPLNSGRCHSMTTHPVDRNIIITSNQIGGLWKTTNGGTTWSHLNGLHALFTSDVCFGPDGNTVICTRNIDNNFDNGGGIWVSRNGGATWSRPATGKIPVFTRRTTSKGVAWGISYDPDSTGKIFVGTSSGIAISSDNGATWRHAMLENTSRVNWQDSLQNQVMSVMAYGGNIAFALTRTGVFKTSDGGISWRNIQAGDFTFGGSFKLMDVWANLGVRGSSYGVFILKDYSTLLLYENYYDRWTTIPLPGGQSRGPFVRVSRAATSGYQSVWVGAGVVLYKITKSRLSSFRPGLVSAASWLPLHRAEGIHDDSGFMGLDADRRITLYGSDGGLFKPLNTAGTRWTNACVRGSGMNSYQITDLAITNYSGIFLGLNIAEMSALYFSTQDNGLWASGDRGVNWPNSDCAEGFHIEVKDRADFFDPTLQVAYGKVGCGPSGSMFSRTLFTNQRMVPTTSTSGLNLGDSILGQAFLINGDNYSRMRFPIMGNQEGYVSLNGGANWRKRYEYSGIGVRGVLHTSRVGADGPSRYWLPFAANGVTNSDGSDKIGLVLHLYPFRTNIATMNSTSIKYLPNNGSLGLRATEFDWQAVFGVNPIDYRHIIAPDIVNGVVKVSRDAGISWVTDNSLTNLVTRNGTTKMNNGIPNIEVTHISWDPYHNNRILVGTRENGVILSDDGGNTWRRIANSPNMLFVTGFAFQPDNIVYVSTYGRGIWKIDFNVFVNSPLEYYVCRSCTIIGSNLSAISINDFSNHTVIEVRGGQITGIGFDKSKRPELQISEKAFYKAWLPEKGNNNLPGIVRTKAKADNTIDALKKTCKDCAVTGVVMKGDEIIGYIVHKEERPLEKEDYATKDYQLPKDDGANEKEEGVDKTNELPVGVAIFAKTYINGLPLINKDDKLTLFINDLKEISFGSVISINGEVFQKVDQSNLGKEKEGYRIVIELPQNIKKGLQKISIQTTNQKNMALSFIIANIDEFEKNNSKNKKLISEKEVIDD